MNNSRIFSAFLVGAALMLHGPTLYAQAGSTGGTIEVYGAVAKPGAQRLRGGTGVSFAEAIESAGGYSDNAFQLGVAVLRVSRLDSSGRVAGALEKCVSLPEQQVVLGVADYVPRDRAQAISQDIATARRYRVPVSLSKITNPGSRSPDVTLIDGDILLIPTRPAHVHVLEAGLPEQLVYVPGWRAEDYTSRAGGGERALSDDDKIVLPSGEIRSLSLGFWEYQPTAVPPGALLVMDAEDAGYCAMSSD